MSLIGTHQFNAVPEGIMNVAAANAGDIVNFLAGDSCAGEFFDQCGVVPAHERRMRLSCRTKVCFDAEVNVNLAALKPAAAALCELGRFGNFIHTQYSGEKRACNRFLPCRHSQLHVIDRGKLRSFR